MPFVTATQDTWTTIVVTTTNTIIQNRGSRPIFVTTQATGSLARDEGVLLEPSSGAIVVGSGRTVSAMSIGRDGRVLYELIGNA